MCVWGVIEINHGIIPQMNESGRLTHQCHLIRVMATSVTVNYGSVCFDIAWGMYAAQTISFRKQRVKDRRHNLVKLCIF